MHQTHTFLIIYGIAINTIGACMLCYDKYTAIKNKKRVPEKQLHAIELAGAVWGMLILMYSIRHKNRKWTYFSVSWLVATLWLTLIYLVIKYQLI